jgi:hypothetical protein
MRITRCLPKASMHLVGLEGSLTVRWTFDSLFDSQREEVRRPRCFPLRRQAPHRAIHRVIQEGTFSSMRRSVAFGWTSHTLPVCGIVQTSSVHQGNERHQC